MTWSARRWRWAWWGCASSLPMFLLTLPAGDITDRFNQRRVYSLAAGLQALCSALFLAA